MWADALPTTTGTTIPNRTNSTIDPGPKLQLAKPHTRILNRDARSGSLKQLVVTSLNSNEID